MLRIAVIILVFTGALFVLISRPPEQVSARSADGIVALNGVSSRVHSVSVEALDQWGVILPSRVSSYYQVIPDLAGTVFVPTFTVQIQDIWKQIDVDATQLTIYVYTNAQTGWQPQSTVLDLISGTLSADVKVFDPIVFAVGVK